MFPGTPKKSERRRKIRSQVGSPEIQKVGRNEVSTFAKTTLLRNRPTCLTNDSGQAACKDLSPDGSIDNKLLTYFSEIRALKKSEDMANNLEDCSASPTTATNGWISPKQHLRESLALEVWSIADNV